ncbi:MAG: hypothetical protein ACRDD9_04780 [Shewanella sp.]
MNEQEIVLLYRSLARSRDGFMKERMKEHPSQPVKKWTQRDREMLECFRNR